MLDEQTKAEIQAAYRQFLDVRKLKPRHSQKLMIATVARSLSHSIAGERISAVEAGTGTGKTLAYLLASVPVAKRSDCKVVVATATVALQEQLLLKDLPQLTEQAGLTINYVLAKGRGRYFCIRLAEQLQQNQNDRAQMALYEDEVAEQLSGSQLFKIEDLLAKFASGGWDGDKDSLTEEVEEKLWGRLTSDHLHCTNRKCPHFDICPFFRARQLIDQADLIVANHDLVLADLSLGGGAILPEPEKTIYIFDEAHHLAAKTIGHFAYSLRLDSTRRWLGRLSKELQKLVQLAPQATTLQSRVEKATQQLPLLEDRLKEFKNIIEPLLHERPLNQDKRYRFSKGIVPLPLAESSRQLMLQAEQLYKQIERISDFLKTAIEGELIDFSATDAELWYPVSGQWLQRLQAAVWLSRSFAEGSRAVSGLPLARWVKIIESTEGTDLECCSSPVSAAETLTEHLWAAAYGVVLTSATLTALGRFDRLSQDLGLPEAAVLQRLPSPFNYQKNAELVVPLLGADPSNAEKHTEAVAEYLQKALPEIGAGLVLFSAWRQMNKVLELLPDKMVENILVQGMFSKQQMLHQHKTRIDNDKPSVLFGLASFAEGVDLPGKYLTEVIIAKLPFSVPDDPIDATLAEWIEEQGGNAFEEWVVPLASMKLTQAVGRLLRTEQDTGKVVLLDRRVISRRYGRQILDSLPPFRRNFS